jgi:hypothetical protein
MDEKIEEMAMIALKNTMSYTCAKQIAMNFYNAGYRKESDTAREIFEKLLCYIGSQQQFCIVDEEHKTLIDCDKLFDFVGNLAKEEYGVDLGE